MKQERFVPFKVTGVDSLGQGVSKLTDKVVFIPKTTLGDEGIAKINSEKKGVVFASVHQLERASADRVQPPCPHFDNCPSCHFQHVTYEKELGFKTESFQKLFRKLPLPQVEVIKAPERLNYRNRIQLHYSLKTKLLGMRLPHSHDILPVPQCQMGVPEIENELKKLYENERWLREAPKDRPEGHVELYYVNNELRKNWNRPYADGGFTQVYQEMNQKLKSILTSEWKLQSPGGLLDLFGGNGNLSQDLNYSQRLCVDIYPSQKGEEFFHQDLYGEKAMKSVLSELKKRQLNVQNLLIDPPRSGLKDLQEWIAALRPRLVAYVSCDPHTLARDLSQLQGYRITRAFLVDFFPSTFHFESMIFLEQNP